MIAVTGANGFIGHHLVGYFLERGHQVRAIDVAMDRLQTLTGHPGLRLIQSDIRNLGEIRGALTDVTVVCHLASAHLSLEQSEREYWEINRDAARRLVELAHKAGVRRFVHCSSVGVYGKIDNPPADEESPCRPDLVYEKSKLAGEQAVLEYARENAFPVTVVRPVWVYGPACQRTEKLFRAVKKGRFFYLGGGDNYRHCIYVEDCCRALELCAEHPAARGQIFVIGDREAVRIRALIAEIAAIQGVKEPRFSLPKWLVWPACLLLEGACTLLGKSPPVSRRSLKFFTNNTSFITDKARRELGFEAKFDLATGLSACRKWLDGQPVSG